VHDVEPASRGHARAADVPRVVRDLGPEEHHVEAGMGEPGRHGGVGILSTLMWPVLLANAAWVVFLSIWALVYFAGAKAERDSGGK
jgi:hypothetical protein